MTFLTEGERRVLARGFQGPRPGSNAFPLLSLKKEGVEVTGERIDELLRAGILHASPRAGKPIAEIKGGNAGPHGEIPDIELTHDYRLKQPI